MKTILKISKVLFFALMFPLFLNSELPAECTNQRGMDRIINNPNNYFNRNISVAGPVERFLDENEGGPGFVIKSAEGKDFFVTGGNIITDNEGNTLWQIKKDINTTDAFGEPIIALVVIKLYPKDYIAIEGSIAKHEKLPFAMSIAQIETFKPEYTLKVDANKNFNISISMPIHPNYDWVLSKMQSYFYCNGKAKLIDTEMVPPTSGLIGSTNKNFIFKAGRSGFSSLKFDNLDYSDKDRPKRINSKSYLVLIE